MWDCWVSEWAMFIPIGSQQFPKWLNHFIFKLAMYESFYGSTPFRHVMRSHFFFFLKKIKHTQDGGNAVDSHDGLHSCFPNSDKCWASSVKCLQITYFVHILLGSVQSSFSYLFPSFLLFWNKSLLHILGTVSIEDMVFASLFLTLSFS